MITKSGVYGINDNSEARDHSEIGTVESGEKSLGVVASAPVESFPSASTPPSLPASTGSASTDPIAFKPTLSASPTASTPDTPGPLTSPEAPSAPTSTQLPSAVVPPASLPDTLSTLAKDTNALSQVHTAPAAADDDAQHSDLGAPMNVDGDDVASLVVVNPPTWLVNTSMPGYLRGISKDRAWQELINSLFRLESLNTTTGVSTYFYSSCHATTYSPCFAELTDHFTSG